MKMHMPLWVSHVPAGQGHTFCEGMHVHTLKSGYQTPFGTLSVYYAQLAEGVCPHEPHGHADAELGIIRSGEMDLIHDGERHRLKPGDIYFLAPRLTHTVEAVTPVDFFMLRWLPEASAASAHAASARIIRGEAPPLPAAGLPPRYNRLPRLAISANVELEPVFAAMGQGHQYPVHVDDYAALMIQLQGPFHGPGFEARAPAAMYFSPGMPHGFTRPCEAANLHLILEIHVLAGSGG